MVLIKEKVISELKKISTTVTITNAGRQTRLRHLRHHNWRHRRCPHSLGCRHHHHLLRRGTQEWHARMSLLEPDDSDCWMAAAPMILSAQIRTVGTLQY